MVKIFWKKKNWKFEKGVFNFLLFDPYILLVGLKSQNIILNSETNSHKKVQWNISESAKGN